LLVYVWFFVVLPYFVLRVDIGEVEPNLHLCSAFLIVLEPWYPL
jgi:hypothetical protein